jgi:hypothetical protein
MSQTKAGAQPDGTDDATQTAPCLTCQGAGAVVMSLCCGRGCATCPGDGMLRAVDCDRCGGTGTLPSAV